ncbi:thiol-disulfide oxidoreductase DCC family protein [Neolewinella sp.]|uniref:thiol-disulfide oxidoreductase DCC family protein n=1 Tax=Neolewinella sp. TaxID=2993543 RepID=UPI003B520688
MDYPTPVLFFDGVCNLCNGAVQTVLKYDRRGQLKFASLQSELAAELLPQLGIDPEALKSLVLYENGTAYTRSEAALRTARLMGGSFATLYYLRLFPRSLRDWVYDLVGRNRYRWFGARAECMLPRPEWRARFVST